MLVIAFTLFGFYPVHANLSNEYLPEQPTYYDESISPTIARLLLQNTIFVSEEFIFVPPQSNAHMVLWDGERIISETSLLETLASFGFECRLAENHERESFQEGYDWRQREKIRKTADKKGRSRWNWKYEAVIVINYRPIQVTRNK